MEVPCSDPRPPRHPRQATRRQFLRWGLVLGGGSLLAACSPTAQPSPTAAPAKPAPTAAVAKPAAAAPARAAPTAAPAVKQLVKVKAGQIATLADAGWNFLPVEKGFFKEEGIDLEFADFRDGGTMFKGLLSGDIDLYEGGWANLPPAMAQGADIRILGGSKLGLAFALYARKDIEQLEDLVGKEVGTASPGSFLHLLMLALFERKGIDPGQVHFVNIGASGDVFRAVAAGKVAAGPAPINFKPQADQNPAIKVLLIIDDVLPDLPRVGFAAQRKVIAEKPEVLARALSAWVKGFRYGVEHLSEVVEQGVEHLKLPAPALEFFFKWELEHNVLSLNLDVTPKIIEYMQKVNVDGAVQEKVLPYEQVVDESIRKQVLAAIGEYQKKA